MCLARGSCRWTDGRNITNARHIIALCSHPHLDLPQGCYVILWEGSVGGTNPSREIYSPFKTESQDPIPSVRFDCILFEKEKSTSHAICVVQGHKIIY